MHAWRKKREVLVFGNPLLEQDTLALTVARELEGKIKGVSFKKIESLSELRGLGNRLIILDVVEGLKKPAILGLDALKKCKALSSHDLDLGFELKLLQKLGKIKGTVIIGLPSCYEKNKAAEEAERLLRRAL